MKAKYRALITSLLLISALLAAPGAHAIVIKASDYKIGTNLTHAFPGMTLEYATSTGNGQFTLAPLVIGSDTDFVNDGAAQFNTLGATYGAADGPGPVFGTPGWAAVYVAFTAPLYSASAVGFDENDNPSVMAAYGQQTITEVDNGGPLPRFCIRSAFGGCLEFHEQTVTSSTPISYILVAGESEENYIAELDIPGISGQAPEPSSLALLGYGLLGLGTVALRRRRYL